MPGELAALTAQAGDTLVAAAVTSAWETVKDRVARLFGRGKRDPAIERKLDRLSSELAAASDAELAGLRRQLATEWQTRFADLVDDDVATEQDLTALVSEIRAVLPRAGNVTVVGRGIAAGGDLSVSAQASDQSVAVGMGDIVSPGPSVPGRENAQPGPA